jgi:hypothetical protein
MKNDSGFDQADGLAAGRLLGYHFRLMQDPTISGTIRANAEGIAHPCWAPRIPACGEV